MEGYRKSLWVVPI